MSLENDLSRIATALESIAKALNTREVHTTPAPVAAQVVEKPVVDVPAVVNTMPAAPFPTVTVTPVTAPVVEPAPVVAAPVAAPFKDKQQMTDFVISSYRALGSEKGAAIQGVLTFMGFANINDVPVDRWIDLKTGIEALK